MRRHSYELAVHPADSLLKHAVALLDSPLECLLPIYQHNQEIVPSSCSPMINRPNDSFVTVDWRTIERVLLLIFALANLWTIEILLPSLLSHERIFSTFLPFYLASLFTGVLLSIHTRYLTKIRHHWTILDQVAYQRCSKILTLIASGLTGLWPMSFYFRWSNSIASSCCIALSGVSLVIIIVKTFDDFFDRTSSLSQHNINQPLINLYHHLFPIASIVSGLVLLPLIIYGQHTANDSIIGYSCTTISCPSITKSFQHYFLGRLRQNFSHPQSETYQSVPCSFFLQMYLN